MFFIVLFYFYLSFLFHIFILSFFSRDFYSLHSHLRSIHRNAFLFFSHHPIHHHLSSILFAKPPLLFFTFIYLLSSFSMSPFLCFRFLPPPLSFRHRSSIDLFSSPTFTLFSHFRRSILIVHHPSLPPFVLSLSCFYPPSLPHPLLPVIVRHTMYSSQHPSPIPSLR